MLRLRIIGGSTNALPSSNAILELRGPSTVGRAADSTIVLADTTVSGQHAFLAFQGDHWSVRDLGSTNGTFLNEQPVSHETRISPGDVLRLGQVRLQVL